MKERKYVCRVYITQGKQIGGEGSEVNSFIIFKIGN